VPAVGHEAFRDLVRARGSGEEGSTARTAPVGTIFAARAAASVVINADGGVSGMG